MSDFGHISDFEDLTWTVAEFSSGEVITVGSEAIDKRLEVVLEERAHLEKRMAVLKREIRELRGDDLLPPSQESVFSFVFIDGVRRVVLIPFDGHGVGDRRNQE